MEILKQRRTIRKYQQKDISLDLLNDLLDSAFRASTVGNMQVYSVEKLSWHQLISISRWCRLHLWF